MKALKLPPRPTRSMPVFFEEYRTKSGLADDLVCHVPQLDGIDSSNRVHLGAELLNELVTSGL